MPDCKSRYRFRLSKNW